MSPQQKFEIFLVFEDLYGCFHIDLMHGLTIVDLTDLGVLP